MRRVVYFWIVVGLLVLFGCGGCQNIQTEPQGTDKIEPAAEPYRPNVPPDLSIDKAFRVIRKFGRTTKTYMTYQDFSKKTNNRENLASWSPEWFFESIVLDLNKDDYWFTVTYNSARRAVSQDDRIYELLKETPLDSIDVSVETPEGRHFVLSDANADGILDYAGRKGSKETEVNKTLLDKMQEKYTWVLDLIKQYYK